MAQVQTLSVTPISEANNRITVIEVEARDGDAVMPSQPAYYFQPGGWPMAFTAGGDGFLESLSFDLKVGKQNAPRQEFGYQIVDVVLTGTDEFIASKVSINPVKPAVFKPKRYEVVTVSDPGYGGVGGWTYDLGRLLPDGEVPCSRYSQEMAALRRCRLFVEQVNVTEVEFIGDVSGSGFDYLTFNGQDSTSLPDEAQAATLSEFSVVNEDGHPLVAEVLPSAGIVRVFRVSDDGSRVPVKGYGSCRVDYTYTASRFKISYDAPDLWFDVVRHGFANYQWQKSNLNDLPDWVYLVKAEKFTQIYRLQRRVEILIPQYPNQANQIDRNLSEQGRDEVERVVTDPDSGAELRLNVVRNVTLTDGLGNPWFLQFNEAP